MTSPPTNDCVSSQFLDVAVSALAVFVGGVLGVALRGMLPSLPGDVVGTFLLPNALACLLIGALHAVHRRLPWRFSLFAVTGFCGGLSTFSGLAHELAAALVDGRFFAPALSVFIEVLVGLTLFALGRCLAVAIMERCHGR